jgi:hypothetical protein
VAADTILFTPVYVGAFFAFMNSMNGGGWRVSYTSKCSVSQHDSASTPPLPIILVSGPHYNKHKPAPLMQDFEEKCSKDYWTTTAIEMVVWPPYQVQYNMCNSGNSRVTAAC